MSKECALLEKIENLKDDDREVIKETLQQFSKYIANTKVYNHIHLLKILKNTINRFPKYCMNHRDSFERFLIHYIDNDHLTTVVYAAQCMLALQQVRPTIDKDATPKSSWKNHMKLLCTAAYKIMVAIFGESVTNVYKQVTDNDGDLENSTKYMKALCDIPAGSDKTRFTNLSRRLSNIFIHIQVMLVDLYPVAKPIAPKIILLRVTQILNVTSMRCPPIDDECVKICKIRALETIDALVVCLHTNLIPYNHLILRLLIQSLQWSGDNSGNNRTKITVRVKTYDSLQKWLTVLHCYIPEKAGSGNFDFENDLIKEIKNDITPSSSVIQLNVFQMQKSSSKKAKRRLMQVNLDECRLNQEPEAQTSNNAKSEEVNIAALKCLQTFILVCGYFMASEKYEAISQLIMSECFKYEEYSEEKTYVLCMTLDTLRKSTPQTIETFLHICLRLFSMFTSNKHLKISTVASNALSDIRMQLYNAPPSLCYPNHAVNRAALENLLGSNRVYPHNGNNVDEDYNDDDDDNIDGAEPASKKRRPDEPGNLIIGESSEMYMEHGDNVSADYSHSVETQQIADNSHENSAGYNETANVFGNGVNYSEQPMYLEPNVVVLENNLDNYFLNGIEISTDESNILNNRNLSYSHEYLNQENPLADSNSIRVVDDTLSTVAIENTNPFNINNQTFMNKDEQIKSGFCANITRVNENTEITTIREHFNTKIISNITFNISSGIGSKIKDMLSDFVDEKA